MESTILKKIDHKNINVCVMGLGYVGLPLAVEMAHAGFTVVGIDNNAEKIRMLNRQESYVQDVSIASEIC